MDVVELVGLLLQLVMYLTPIMYPMSILPERWHWIVRFNPVRSVLEVFRDPIYYGKVPPLEHVAVALGLALAALAVGALVFRQSSHRMLPNEDFAVARVAERVRMGGHNVPDETIRRRYRAGLRNFFKLYRPLADTWFFYDNSAEEPRR